MAGALICCATALSVACLPCSAYAEDIDTNPSADAFQQRIEETAATYSAAAAEATAAAEAVEDNKKRIAELEREIPKQQARGEAAARELYKVQQQGIGIVELLLSADSFFDFLSNLEYIDRITSSHMQQIELLADMKSELDEKQAGLEQAKADADAREAAAKEALAAAQQARVEAQRRAQEAARSGSGYASTGSSGTTFTTAPSDTAATDSDKGQSESPSESGQNEGQASGAPAPEPEPIVDDGANWMSEEDVFVSEWSGRIDAYLAGSPLYGYGAVFARAAWNYGVDPRWSPAISCTESSKGLYCFLPHNAWGWGSVSWGSWEEAIDAHVRGLARGYGYTISWEAACKYCPPNAEHWYSFTLSQMNMI